MQKLYGAGSGYEYELLEQTRLTILLESTEAYLENLINNYILIRYMNWIQ